MAGEKVNASATAAGDASATVASPGVEEQLAALTEPAAVKPTGEESVEDADTASSEQEAGEESQPVEGEEGEQEQSGEESEGESGDESDEQEDEKPAGKHRSPAAERRIAELTAKRHEAEERAAQAESRLKALDEVAMQRVPVNPEYLTPEEHKMVVQANELQAERAWLTRNLTNGGTHPGTGKDLTPEEVQARLAEVFEQDSLMARARVAFERAQRQQWEDMRRGRALRLAEAKKPTQQQQVTRQPVAQVKPGAGSPAKQVKPPPPRPGIDVKRFEKNGGGMEAAAMELENI